MSSRRQAWEVAPARFASWLAVASRGSPTFRLRFSNSLVRSTHSRMDHSLCVAGSATGRIICRQSAAEPYANRLAVQFVVLVQAQGRRLPITVCSPTQPSQQWGFALHTGTRAFSEVRDLPAQLETVRRDALLALQP